MVEKFLMKKGQVINAIASDFLKKSVGDKVSSISEYQEELEVARGTVQNAISYLKNEGAFKLISKGHQGSFQKLIMKYCNLMHYRKRFLEL